MSRFVFLAALAATSFSSLVFAEDVPADGERAGQVIVTDPYYGQQQQPQDPYAQQQQYPYGQQQQQPVQVVEQPTSAQQGRGFEYGGSLFVPVWIGTIAKYYNPGIGIDLRAGWELGHGLSFDGHLGFTYNGVRSYYDTSLQSAYLGAGLRYAFLNRSALVPFVQAGLQLNVWSICYDVNCKGSFSTVNFGAYGGAGVLFEINPNAAFDFGVNFMTTLGSDGGIFAGFETSVQPFVGLTLFY